MPKEIFLAVLSLHFVLSIPVFAQTSNATLGGTVSDATGALIPGVSVTATNVATGIVTTVLTNEAGAYQFASLQTGTYKVVAELSGFQTQTYNNVTLGISQQVRSRTIAADKSGSRTDWLFRPKVDRRPAFPAVRHESDQEDPCDGDQGI